MNRDLTSLDRLHDILVPDPVPWWPVAPGWWWVMGAALLFLFVVQLRAFARWQHNHYRRQALGELAALEASLKDPAHRPAVLLELAVLLKRTALTAYPRGEIASLSGPEWSSFLDRTAVGSRFSQGSGQVLHSAVHDPRTVAALEERTVHDLMREVREWIRHHQPTVTAP